MVVSETPPTVAVDFDYTIADDDGNLLPGAVEALNYLHKTGWRVVIWTAREDLDFVREFLDEYGIPFDYVNENPDGDTGSRKIFFHATVDDRAVAFDGDWARALAELERRRSIWHIQGATKSVRVMEAGRDGVFEVASFRLEGGRAVETTGSTSEIIKDMLESGLDVGDGVVSPESGKEFLKALLDLQGTYLWTEVS